MSRQRGEMSVSILPPPPRSRPSRRLTGATARPPGLVLGYAGLGEAAIARGVERMAEVFESTTGLTLLTEAELYSDHSPT
jgi:hypothetical protein